MSEQNQRHDRPARLVVDRRVRPHVGPREQRQDHLSVTFDRRRRSREDAKFDELVRALTSAAEVREDGKRRFR